MTTKRRLCGSGVSHASAAVLSLVSSILKHPFLQANRSHAPNETNETNHINRLRLGIRLLSTCAALALIAIPAGAQSCVTNSLVTLTGTLRGSNGAALPNGTLSLAPSATGYIPACGINVASTVSCATSSDGSVVGLGNPIAPTLASVAYGSGTLGVGTYYIRFTFYDAAGNQTLPSPEQYVQLTYAGSITVNAPTSGVPGSGMKVYIGATSGSETLQGTTTGQNSYVQSSALVSGAALPGSNTTLCQVTANDAMWPFGTGYVVSLIDQNGNQIPRFQQQWQLNGPGSTINLANGLPYYHGVVYYPSPLLASPTNHGQQSISGPLALNGYNLTGVGRLGVNTTTPGYELDVNGSMNLSGQLLINGQPGASSQCLVSQGVGLAPLWTTCPSSGGGTQYYQTVQSNGTNLVQRPTINFTSRFASADNGAQTRTDIDLAQTAVVAGSYTNTNLTVDAYGRVTAASNGAAPPSVGVDKYVSGGGCTTGSLSYSECTATLTWPSGGFSDGSIFVGCALIGPFTGHPYLVGVDSFSATTVTVRISNGTSSGATTSAPSAVHCHGHHN